MGAGAVVAATGERGLDCYGGLARRMPRTTAAMLIAALAIAALPPLNGFVSEWLLFQAVLASPDAARLVPEARGAGRRRRLRAGGGSGRRGVRAPDRHHLPRRPRSARRRAARATGRTASRPRACCSRRRPAWCWARCRRWPSSRCRRSCRRVLGARMPDGWSGPWRSLVPMPTSASSYNGLIILVFLAVLGDAGRGDAAAARLGRAAPRARLGLRLSRSATRHPVHRRKASRSR